MDEKDYNKLDKLRKQLEEAGTKKLSGRPRKWKDEYINAQAEKLNQWLDTKSIEQLFWLKEYLLESGLTYQQIRTFGDLSFPYKKALERLHTMQEVALCKYATTPKNNFIFAMFALKAICGWSDGRSAGKQESKQATYTDKITEDREENG